MTTIHEAYQTLLGEETDYAVSVDDPGGRTDYIVQDLDSATQILGALAADATTPVHVTDSGDLELSKTCYGQEAELGNGNWTLASASADWTGSGAVDLATGDWSTTFTVTHEIPSKHVNVRLRRRLDAARGEILVAIDGQIVHGDYYGADDGTDESLHWVDGVGGDAFNLGPGDRGTTPDPPPTLTPGEHTLSVYVRDITAYNDPVSGEWALDYAALYDDRYTPTFPNSTDSIDILLRVNTEESRAVGVSGS